MIGKKRYETICYMSFLKMPFCSQRLGYQIFLNNINNFFLSDSKFVTIRTYGHFTFESVKQFPEVLKT